MPERLRIFGFSFVCSSSDSQVARRVKCGSKKNER
jgi:hypothetical protein